jgi:DNA invertase Pin-like site-specific DNA recombinase
MILEKASKSEKKEVRSLQEKYGSLSSILREFGVKDSQIQLIKTEINKERHNLKLIGDFV